MPDVAWRPPTSRSGWRPRCTGRGSPSRPSGRLASRARCACTRRPSREPLYWTARVTLVSGRAQLPVFDAVFAALFDGTARPVRLPRDPGAPPPIGSEPRTRTPAPGARPSDGEADGGTPSPSDGPPSGDGPEREVPVGLAATTERLGHTSFADLAPDEIAEARRLVRRLVLSTPVRRTRRPALVAGGAGWTCAAPCGRRSGPPATRCTSSTAVAAAAPRRLVLLCDVSGSMEPSTRVYLSLLQGAVSGARAEAFVFSTRLTRLTRQLSARDPDSALARPPRPHPTGAAAPAWPGACSASSTTTGGAASPAGRWSSCCRTAGRSTSPTRCAAQMARLRRLALRIVWVNPRKAAAGLLAARRRHGRRPPLLRRLRQRPQPRGARRGGRGDPRTASPLDREEAQMKLDSTFTVTAPIEEVWKTLMDFEQVAGCVPGAQVLNKLSEDAYQVAMKVKLGPVTMQYKGQMEVVERDERDHRAILTGQAKEARGQGTASATATLSLVEEAGLTRGTVAADLALSGRAAAMGQGVIGSVTDQMMGQFAANLQAMLDAGPTGGAAAGPPLADDVLREAGAPAPEVPLRDLREEPLEEPRPEPSPVPRQEPLQTAHACRRGADSLDALSLARGMAQEQLRRPERVLQVLAVVALLAYRLGRLAGRRSGPARGPPLDDARPWAEPRGPHYPARTVRPEAPGARFERGSRVTGPGGHRTAPRPDVRWRLRARCRDPRRTSAEGPP